ncbi:unnamed protein product [Caretta caretta]
MTPQCPTPVSRQRGGAGPGSELVLERGGRAGPRGRRGLRQPPARGAAAGSGSSTIMLIKNTASEFFPKIN